MVEGVDYAGTRPDPRQLYAAGKRFAVRYGGPGGSWKHLDATEARALTGAGLALVANAEGAADGLLLGWDAGVSWARSADAHFRALGMPADRPVYLSVDFDCDGDKQWGAVANALRGAASVIGPARVGVYGSYDVMQWAKRDGVARWYWQTYAWSGGRWASHNHLEQYRNGVSLAGGTVDLNRSKTTDFGQWGQGDDDMLTPDQDRVLRNCERYLWRSAYMQDFPEIEYPVGVVVKPAIPNWPARTVREMSTKLDGLTTALTTALELLRTGGGDADTAAILARIDQRATEDAARDTATAEREQQLLARIAELEDRLAAAARAEADALDQA